MGVLMGSQLSSGGGGWDSPGAAVVPWPAFLAVLLVVSGLVVAAVVVAGGLLAGVLVAVRS